MAIITGLHDSLKYEIMATVTHVQLEYDVPVRPDTNAKTIWRQWVVCRRYSKGLSIRLKARNERNNISVRILLQYYKNIGICIVSVLFDLGRDFPNGIKPKSNG